MATGPAPSIPRVITKTDKATDGTQAMHKPLRARRGLLFGSSPGPATDRGTPHNREGLMTMTTTEHPCRPTIWTPSGP